MSSSTARSDAGDLAPEARAARELTVRAVGAGLAIGSVLAVANVYMGLKTGWWDGGSITASIVGFSIFSTTRLGGSRYSVLENNITQTTAGAVASMPSTAGLLGAIPALDMLGRTVSYWTIMAWGLALGVFGTLLGLALRRRLIVDEALPFPSGVATAQVISAMHAAARDALGRARSLFAGAFGAMAAVWLRDGRPAWIPQVTALPGRVAGVPLASLGFGIGWSPMLVGAGVLVGPHIAVSWLLGALVAWGGLAPALVNRALVPRADYDALVAWLMWPGASLMLAATVVSLAEQGRTALRTLAGLRGFWRGAAPGSVVAAVPTRAAGALLVGAVALTVLVGWRAFGMHPLFTLLALALCVPLGAVCGRAAGETDVAPLGQVGQLTQVLVSPATAGQLAVDIGGASVVSGSAAQTTQLLWSLRTGHELGGSPRQQVYASLIGVGVGAVLVGPAYFLLTRAYGLGSQALPAPYGSAWKAVAEVLVHGSAALPPHAGWASAIAFAVGLVLAIASRGRLARFVPSVIALGVGFIAPCSFAFSVALGGLLVMAARAAWPDATERHASALGGGAIAGESVMGVIIAVLLAAGVLPAP